MSTQDDFAATVVDEWARAGVVDAVVSPGSRSSPLTVALFAHPSLTVHMRLDERSAGFFALGCALGADRPVVVVTTSGTAAAELHPAVVEADLAGVPLIVCTADRPPELHDVGAAQTIEQHAIYGLSPRASFDLGVPDESTRAVWRSYASRLVADATTGPRGPGPVHANLPFRDPLSGAVGTPQPGRSTGNEAIRSVHQLDGSAAVSDAAVSALVEMAQAERGVIIAGGGIAANGAPAILDLAARLGWAVLADPRAWPRLPVANLVAACDGILRAESALVELNPEVVLHVGAPHASRVVAQWSAATATQGATHVFVDPYGRFLDPDRIATGAIVAEPVALAEAVLARLVGALGFRAADDRWITAWQRAELAAQQAIDEVLASQGGMSEPALARRLFALLPPKSTVVASSSMPIRDLEWFTKPRANAARVLANRGANGIDGVTSTVLGVAATTEAGPVVGLVGDLAFLHDLSGLVWGRAEQRPNAVLIVVDNDGGGIFNFLGYSSVLDDEVFERAFATPQACDVATVARGLGCPVVELRSLIDLDEVIARPPSGITVVVATTERRANVELHDRLHQAIAAAVDVALAR